MVTVQSQSGLLVRRAEAKEGKVRVTGIKQLFKRPAYSVLVDEGNERTVMAGTLEQVTKMLMHKQLVKEAVGVVEAVSIEMRDGSDLFSPVKVEGGISGTLCGADIACLVAIKNGVNETSDIAEVFGISLLKIHARIMELRRCGLVCREDGTLLKYFLTTQGLEIVARGMGEEPFVQSRQWLGVRKELGEPQMDAPQNSY
jgi:hypothetical protein